MTVQVADQAVQFIRDLGEIPIGMAAKFGALGVEARDAVLGCNDEFRMLADQRRLPTLDLSVNERRLAKFR